MAGADIPQRLWSVSYELDDTGQTALFDEDRAELVVLNEVAAAIWYLADGVRDVDSIVRFLQDESPAAAEAAEVESSVHQFIHEMVARGGLRLAPPRP